MKAKTIAYWVSTALLAFVFILGGVFYVIGARDAVVGVMNLGFPRYFIPFLGIWKVLGGIAILIPGFPRAKEWAYAGIFFDLTAAALASSAMASPSERWHIIPPVVFTGFLFASWALRPASRVLVPASALAN